MASVSPQTPGLLKGACINFHGLAQGIKIPRCGSAPPMSFGQDNEFAFLIRPFYFLFFRPEDAPKAFGARDFNPSNGDGAKRAGIIRYARNIC